MERVKRGIKKIVAKTVRIFFPYSLIIDRYSVIERMSMNFAKGALSRSVLRIDNACPHSWEFSAFSQNSEDGIIDFLASFISTPNRYFIEIGSSDGLENNSSYLAFAKKYSGIMIEGDQSKAERAKKYLERFNWGVEYINSFVDKDNISELLTKKSLYLNPDFFSLDIDGIDFYVMESVLSSGYRPKIVSVEYNSTFGPTRELTIIYKADFEYGKAHPSHFYYGVSVAGWKKLFRKYNYEFVTVDSNGVNAFFIDRTQFRDDLPAAFHGSEFLENFALRARLKNYWSDQFEQIKTMPYYEL
jgi:hypothetical protein